MEAKNYPISAGFISRSLGHLLTNSYKHVYVYVWLAKSDNELPVTAAKTKRRLCLHRTNWDSSNVTHIRRKSEKIRPVELNFLENKHWKKTDTQVSPLKRIPIYINSQWKQYRYERITRSSNNHSRVTLYPHKQELDWT